MQKVPPEDISDALGMLQRKSDEDEVQEVMKLQCLDTNESIAICFYPFDLSLLNPSLESLNAWRVANTLLRDRNMAELERLHLREWLYWLLKGLLKLPPWKGTAYRGLDTPLLEISKRYVQGKQVTWTAFTSTTTDKETTMRKFGSGTKGGTYVKIEVTDGRDISAFSPFAENERLLLPNATFTVVQALPYAQAIDFFKFVGATVNLPPNTDLIMLQQIETPKIGCFLQKKP